MMPLSPLYILKVEKSKVNVKDAEMPKSFFGHNSAADDRICFN